MPEIPDLLTMLKAGVHFGHKISKRHPKMKPYIFMAKNGFHIINIEETQVKLKEALDFIKKIVSNGGTILFLGTKKQAQAIIVKAAKDCGMPYIKERWLGGTFTNFSSISKLIKKYKPDIMAVESLYFFKNLKTAMPVSQAKGVILFAAAKKKIPVFEFSPLQMKMTITGYGKAEKKQVQKMIKILLGLKERPEDKNKREDDATDALGIAICGALKMKLNIT